MPKLSNNIQYSPRVTLDTLPDIELDDLEDVDTTGQAQYDLLSYDGSQWAPGNGIEVGTFTPTLTFDTPGDLANSYTVQKGNYWKFGPIVHFAYALVDTPTWTTASGNLRLGGLPYTADAESSLRWSFIGRISASGITWPGGKTNAIFFLTEGNDYLSFQVNGSAAGVSNVTAADMTTAVANNFRTSGFYVTDA